MTLRELSQLYHLNREIDEDKKRLEELRVKSCYPQSTIGMPDVSGSTAASGSKVDRYAAETADLEAIISAKLIQCMHERNRLERYIADIPDSLTRQIFTLRFINGLSWLQVAYSLGGNNTESSVKMICYRYIDKENEKEV